MSDLNIKPILEWFQQAKPNPKPNDALTQIGCHYEEVSEMLTSTLDGIESCDIEALADSYKNACAFDGRTSFIDLLPDKAKINLLDSLCDQIVTAIGVAYMVGFDIEKALLEVNRSNWSKFVDGKPQFNEQGKIAKPESYSPPELSEFIK